LDGEVTTKALTPLLVVHPGRSGSTLMMRFLSTSPEISMEHGYPFEAYYFQYLSRLSRLIDSPGLPHWERTDFFGQMRDPTVTDGLVGPPPWPERLRTTEEIGNVSLGQRILQASWQAFTEQVRVRDRDAIWWAEKAPVASPVEPGGPFDARVLYMVRDPRDVLLSWKAYDRARGPDVVARRAFARERTLEGALGGARRFLSRASEGFHVRYEDAVLDPDAVARTLSEWLGTEISAPGEVDEQHLTSRSPGESIERWETEMDEETKARYAHELGTLLSAFGYRI
jgi:hypothetical protein